MSDENQTPVESPEEAPVEAPARKSDRGWSRWLRIALVLSLAINLLFIGYAGTRAYHFRYGRFNERGDIGLVMHEAHRFVRDLPRERRHEIIALFRAHRDEFHDDRREIDAAVRSLAEVLRADDFNRDTLDAAVASLRGRVDGLVERGSDVTIEILMALSDQERRDFADRLLDRLP